MFIYYIAKFKKSITLIVLSIYKSEWNFWSNIDSNVIKRISSSKCYLILLYLVDDKIKKCEFITIIVYVRREISINEESRIKINNWIIIESVIRSKYDSMQSNGIG